MKFLNIYRHRSRWALLFLLFAFAMSASVTASHNEHSSRAKTNIIRLATTTSTDNSGLLEYLLPKFQRASGYRVRVISVGTGKALRLGSSGDVDVLLVHAPQSEKQFIAAGHGVDRRQVMANDFVIVGPENDPADLHNATSAMDAFRRLRQSEQIFISRGDDSGTHKKELRLWQAANVNPKFQLRREVGQGMGKSLQIADELRGYLLIDRATWIFLQHTTSLALVYDGDSALHNPYSAMAVNPKRHPVNYDGALALIKWLTSSAGQIAIGDYTVHNAQLFFPVQSK